MKNLVRASTTGLVSISTAFYLRCYWSCPKFWFVCFSRLGVFVGGWILGSLLVLAIPAFFIPPTWSIELLTSLTAYVFMFLGCTYLKWNFSIVLLGKSCCCHKDCSCWHLHLQIQNLMSDCLTREQPSHFWSESILWSMLYCTLPQDGSNFRYIVFLDIYVFVAPFSRTQVYWLVFYP